MSVYILVVLSNTDIDFDSKLNLAFQITCLLSSVILTDIDKTTN